MFGSPLPANLKSAQNVSAEPLNTNQFYKARQVRASFCLEKTMSDIIQLVPNKWVTEELLTATTGMSKHMIQHARRSTWMEGKHYRHVAPDMAPKQNSPIMYNRDEINHWIEHQSPAKRRRISA